jgi:hypothetical protein
MFPTWWEGEEVTGSRIARGHLDKTLRSAPQTVNPNRVQYSMYMSTGRWEPVSVPARGGGGGGGRWIRYVVP